jgi:hypothetical protein
MRTIAMLVLAGCMNAPPADTTMPALGGRIFDRVGRAAVNTALIGVLMPRGQKDDLQQAYNEAAPDAWSMFTSEIAKNLAVYDALDAICGNQALAGASAIAGRYDGLAGALADDRLYVNTNAASCTQYLAVELDATGLAPNQDCGGRTPRYDTIDTTYSALAIGLPAGVADGVASDAGPIAETFPFFGPP